MDVYSEQFSSFKQIGKGIFLTFSEKIFQNIYEDSFHKILLRTRERQEFTNICVLLLLRNQNINVGRNQMKNMIIMFKLIEMGVYFYVEAITKSGPT